MVFHRRNRRRRRRRLVRRRRTRRRGVVLDPERKDVTIPFGPGLLAALTFIHLNDINQSVLPTGRIGRQAIMTGVFGQLDFSLGAGVVIPTWIKIWLVHDVTPDGAMFTAADFFTDPTIPTVSMRNLGFTRRLRVVWARKIMLDSFHPGKTVKINKRLRVTTRFDGTGGGITDVISGALTLVIVHDQPAGSLPSVLFEMRTRFVG